MRNEMTSDTLQWTPDPFSTGFERRTDGALLLEPRGKLPAYPDRFMAFLENWAALAPERILVARRCDRGEWQTVTYAQMLARVQRLAAGLATRGLSEQRPILRSFRRLAQQVLFGSAARSLCHPEFLQRSRVNLSTFNK